MFQVLARGLTIEHRHSDGSWAELEPEGPPHDAAEHDAERQWLKGRIYRCSRCSEEIRVTVEPDEQSAAV